MDDDRFFSDSNAFAAPNGLTSDKSTRRFMKFLASVISVALELTHFHSCFDANSMF